MAKIPDSVIKKVFAAPKAPKAYPPPPAPKPPQRMQSLARGSGRTTTKTPATATGRRDKQST